MELITIELRGSGVIVHDGRLKKSRLYATADTLQIYKIGAVKPENKDTVFWHCQNQCIVRHIPLTKLKLYNCGCGKGEKTKLSDLFLRGLWDVLHCDICDAVLDADGACPNCGKVELG